jgi:hypothetical protein
MGISVASFEVEMIIPASRSVEEIYSRIYVIEKVIT